MTPLEALNRVVYLMDRSLAEPNKVNAFRNAAAVVAELPDGRDRGPGRGRHRHRPGRHRQEHRRRSSPRRWPARCPTRIADLEARLGRAAQRRRHALPRGAQGRLPQPQLLVRRLGARSSRWPAPPWSSATTTSCSPTTRPGSPSPTASTPSACASSSSEIAFLNERLAPFRVLTGIEVDILEDGSLDQDDDLLDRLDVVVASVHSKLRMDRDRHDPADGAGRGQPPRRHPRPLHRPQAALDRAPRWRPTPRSCGPSRSSTPRSCSRPAPGSTPRSRSTAGPSARTRPTSCSSWPSSGTARSRSTPTPTPPASSSGRTSAATRRPATRSTIDSIVNTWAGRRAASNGPVAPHRVASPGYVEEDQEAQDQRPPQEGQPRPQAQRRPGLSRDRP